MVALTGNLFGAGGLRLLPALLCLVVAGQVGAAVDVRLDRDRVYEGDVVTLSIENSGQQGATPDLTPLESDFEVVGTGTSSSFRIVNGRSSSRSSWTVRLRPRRTGTLQVPALDVGGEQTRALTVEVSEIPETVGAQQNPHAFIEVETDADGPVYVQQQLAYTVRLFQGERVTAEELRPPRVEGAVVEQLGPEQHYTATRDGRRYRVTERRYAIAAERSGTLRIPPAAFRGSLAPPANSGPAGGRRDPLGGPFFGQRPFASDPFFGNAPFAGGRQPLKVSSKAITIDVQPPPATAAGHWLPAASVTLQDSWATDPPRLRSGEPVSRTITIQARGVNGAQLPALAIAQPEDTRLYPGTQVNDTRSDGKAVYAISRQTFTYIPSRAGRLAIPPVELGWWNTTTHGPDSTGLPRWELEVAAGAPGSTAPAAGSAPPSPAADGSVPAPPAGAASGSGGGAWWWPLPVAILVAAGGWLLRRRRQRPAAAPMPTARPAPVPPPQAALPTPTEMVATLAGACADNDPATAAHALLALGHGKWPDAPPANLHALARRLGRGEDAIAALDRALYAAGDHAWDGTALAAALSGVDWRPGGVAGEAHRPSLQPLYPHEV